MFSAFLSFLWSLLSLLSCRVIKALLQMVTLRFNGYRLYWHCLLSLVGKHLKALSLDLVVSIWHFSREVIMSMIRIIFLSFLSPLAGNDAKNTGWFMRHNRYFQSWPSLGSNRTATVPRRARPRRPCQADPTSPLYQSGMSTPWQLQENLTHSSLCLYPPSLFYKRSTHPFSYSPCPLHFIHSCLMALARWPCLFLPSECAFTADEYTYEFQGNKRDACWWANGPEGQRGKHLSPLGHFLLSLLFPGACLLSDMYCLLCSSSSSGSCSMPYWCSNTLKLLSINALLFCSSFWRCGCNQT